MLGSHGRLQRGQSLVAVRQHEIAVLLEVDPARIVELLGGGLEELDALLTQPNIEIEPPLHPETSAIPAGGATRELARVDD